MARPRRRDARFRIALGEIIGLPGPNRSGKIISGKKPDRVSPARQTLGRGGGLGPLADASICPQQVGLAADGQWDALIVLLGY